MQNHGHSKQNPFKRRLFPLNPISSVVVFRFARMRKSRYEVKLENRGAHAKVGEGGGDYCWLVTKGSVSLKMLSLYRVVA